LEGLLKAGPRVRIRLPPAESQAKSARGLSGDSGGGDWLFLDEATSALDEKMEAEIYRRLSEVLPDTTIVSIGHRSTLIAPHRRHIEMQPGQGCIFEPTTLLERAAVIG
jgi:ABC-type multidrug transport system fused ATPase/permease subunit